MMSKVWHFCAQLWKWYQNFQQKKYPKYHRLLKKIPTYCAPKNSRIKTSDCGKKTSKKPCSNACHLCPWGSRTPKGGLKYFASHRARAGPKLGQTLSFQIVVKQKEIRYCQRSSKCDDHPVAHRSSMTSWYNVGLSKHEYWSNASFEMGVNILSKNIYCEDSEIFILLENKRRCDHHQADVWSVWVDGKSRAPIHPGGEGEHGNWNSAPIPLPLLRVVAWMNETVIAILLHTRVSTVPSNAKSNLNISRTWGENTGHNKVRRNIGLVWLNRNRIASPCIQAGVAE